MCADEPKPSFGGIFSLSHSIPGLDEQLLSILCLGGGGASGCSPYLCSAAGGSHQGSSPIRAFVQCAGENLAGTNEDKWENVQA